MSRRPAGRWRLALLAGCALVLGQRAAHAGSVAVVVTGDEAERQGKRVDQVDDAVRKRLATERWSVAETGPLLASDIQDMVTCLDGRAGDRGTPASGSERAPQTRDCAAALTNAVTADRFLIIRLAHNERGHQQIDIAGWLLDKRGDFLASDGQSCAACEPPQLEQTTTDLFSILWRKARVRASVGLLKIRSTPTGATIEIDGKSAGVTDSDHEVSPGAHTIVLTKDGFEPATIPVRVGVGEALPVPSNLRVKGETPTGPSLRAWTDVRRGPLVVAGVGAAVMATGLVFVAMDEDASRTDPHYRNSAPSGAAAIGLGVVTVGAAAAWHIWSVTSDRDAARATINAAGEGPQVGIVDGGLWLGYRGRY